MSDKLNYILDLVAHAASGGSSVVWTGEGRNGYREKDEVESSVDVPGTGVKINAQSRARIPKWRGRRIAPTFLQAIRKTPAYRPLLELVMPLVRDASDWRSGVPVGQSQTYHESRQLRSKAQARRKALAAGPKAERAR